MSETPTAPDAVEQALALGLEAAVAAGRLDVVAQLTAELTARREAREASNVVMLDPARRRNGGRS